MYFSNAHSPETITLHFSSVEEALESNHANTRYGNSRTNEEYERSIGVAKKIKGMLARSRTDENAFQDTGFTEVEYIVQNLLACASSHEDTSPHPLRAFDILQSIVPIPEAAPILIEPVHAHLPVAA